MAHFAGNIEIANINLTAVIKNGVLAIGREHAFAFAGTVNVAQIGWENILKGGALAAGREHASAFAGNSLVTAVYFKVT
jgi:hypothetical protein